MPAAPVTTLTEPAPSAGEMQHIEMLLCFENRSWDTLVLPVPARLGEDREQVTRYVEEHYGRQCQYRRVVAWQVSCFQPGAE
jgi:hypothetical protein